MKTNKTWSIDIESVLALKEKKVNESAVINALLKAYLKCPDDKQAQKSEIMDLEIMETKAKLAKQELARESIKKKEIAEKGVPFKFGNRN